MAKWIVMASHNPLSRHELPYAKKLVNMCQEILSIMADAAFTNEDDVLTTDFDETLDSLNAYARCNAGSGDEKGPLIA